MFRLVIFLCMFTNNAPLKLVHSFASDPSGGGVLHTWGTMGLIFMLIKWCEVGMIMHTIKWMDIIESIMYIVKFVINQGKLIKNMGMIN